MGQINRELTRTCPAQSGVNANAARITAGEFAIGLMLVTGVAAAVIVGSILFVTWAQDALAVLSR